MKQKIIIAVLAICLIAVQWTGAEHVKAASCNVTLSMEEKSVTVQDTFVITIDLEGEEAISGVEMMLSYDSDLLEYVSGSPAVSGGDGSLKISDMYLDSESMTARYVIKFQVEKVGISYIKVNPNASVYNEASGQSMSVASNVLTVVGNAGEDASNNVSLKTLKISGGALQPEFSPEVTEYTVAVEKDTDRLIIGAEPEDSKAKVKVNGAEDIKPGENKISIIVTAENGDTREYTILAKKQEQEQVTQEPEEEQEETPETQVPSDLVELTFEPITATKKDEQIVLTTYAQFVVKELSDQTLLPEGYESTAIQIDGCTVTAYQKAEQSDFVLIYASREGTEPAFYQYDMVEKTLQRLNQGVMAEDEIPASTEPEPVKAVKFSPYDALLIGLVVLSLIFMGISVILYHRSKKKH